MKILMCVLVFFVSCSLFAASYNISAPDDLKKYIPEVENSLSDLVDKIIASRKDVVSLMSNIDPICNDIADYLSCPEKKFEISNKILFYLYESNIILDSLSEIKLVSQSSIAGEKQLQKGYVNYEFPKEGATSIIFSGAIYDPTKSKGKLYFPVVITKDGKILEKEKLIAGLLEACGVGNIIPALMIRGIVDSTMTEMLEINYPFGRWYTEGMTYKISSLVLAKHNKKIATDFDKLFVLNAKSENLKNKVNLWNYPQIYMISNLDKEPMNVDLDTANIQYSCILANDLVKKIGEDGISKINGELKYGNVLSNTQICKVISDLFDFDFQSMILQYTPEDVRNIIKSENITKIKEDAEKSMEGKKWNEAISLIDKVLEANPYDYSSWLNLATCKREIGNNQGADKDIMVAVYVLQEGDITISINGLDTDEHAQVVFAKFLFIQGSYRATKDILTPIYERHSDWADVKELIDNSELMLKRYQKIAEEQEKREQAIREYQENLNGKE